MPNGEPCESPGNELLCTYLICSLAANHYPRFVKFLKSLDIHVKWKSSYLPELWPRVGALSLLDPFRADMLLAQLEASLTLSGDVAEFGVFRGGTAMLCALLLQRLGVKKKLHLFDSFQGLPDPDRRYDERYVGGDMRSSETDLRNLIKRIGVEDICVVHPGWFDDTVARLRDTQQFCFVHVDCDLYESAKTALRASFVRLVTHGTIALDDYYDASGGVFDAVQETLSGQPITIQIGPAPQAFIRREAAGTSQNPTPSYSLLQDHSAYLAYVKAFQCILSSSAEGLSLFQERIVNASSQDVSSQIPTHLLAQLRILLT